MSAVAQLSTAHRVRAEWVAALDDVPLALDVRAAGPGEVPLIAVGGGQEWLSIHDLEGDLVDRQVVPGGVLALAWSAPQRIVAAGGTAGAWVWHEGRGVTQVSTGWCSAVAWTGTGRLAVAAGRTASVLDPAAAGQLWSTPEQPSTVTDVLWLRDGRELAVAAYGGICAYTRGRRAPARHLPYAGSLLSAAASPDGRWMISGNQDASLHVWRLRDGAEFEMAGLPGKVSRVAFDASGRWLAANSSAESTVWDFSGRGPAGTSPRVLTAHPDGATALAWHPAEPWLATGGADGVLAVWDVTSAVPGRPQAPTWSATVAPAARRGISAVTWSAGGAQVLVGTTDGDLAAYRVV